MFEKVIIVDARQHMLGRLASTIAKEALGGQRIVIVRAEEANISGSLFRNQIKWYWYLKKRMNTNPRKGPYHYRSPARIIWRVIRGMLPHKTECGQAALGRIKVYEGIPHPFDKLKRVVIPQALRNLRLKPGRKYCRLGDLASRVGWSHNDLVKRLEESRKVRSAAFYTAKKAIAKLRTKAIANTSAALTAVEQPLAKYGYSLSL